MVFALKLWNRTWSTEGSTRWPPQPVKQAIFHNIRYFIWPWILEINNRFVTVLYLILSLLRMCFLLCANSWIFWRMCIPFFKLKICSSIFWRVWFFIHSSVLFKNDVYIYSSFFQIVNIIIIASLSLGTCQWCNHTVKFVQTAVYIESFHNFSLGVDDHRLGVTINNSSCLRRRAILTNDTCFAGPPPPPFPFPQTNLSNTKKKKTNNF